MYQSDSDIVVVITLGAAGNSLFDECLQFLPVRLDLLLDAGIAHDAGGLKDIAGEIVSSHVRVQEAEFSSAERCPRFVPCPPVSTVTNRFCTAHPQTHLFVVPGYGCGPDALVLTIECEAQIIERFGRGESVTLPNEIDLFGFFRVHLPKLQSGELLADQYLGLIA